MNLKDKVAIVTGSSKGLGKVLAEQLLAKGAHVVGWSRSGTNIQHDHFTDDKVDVGKEEDVTVGFKKVIDQYGNVDILINNAGFGVYNKVEEVDNEVLRSMFDTNVLGIFYLTKLAVPVMKAAKSGHIVNISSIAGIMGVEKMSAYNATKFAVKGMSESLFKELRPDGIKVTCVLPGSIQTEFFDDLVGFTPSKTMMNARDVAESIIFCLEAPGSLHPVNLELRPFNA